VLASLSSKEDRNHEGLHGLYIYDWPSHIIIVPPNKHDEKRHFHLNNGLGQLLDADIGFYETSPYSLFQYMIARLKLHPSRVFDPEKASAFFIPFDITHNTWECSKSNISTKELSPRASFAIAELTNSKYFKRNNGKDHFFIEDDSPFFDWKHDFASWRQFHDLCKNCLTVTPDNTKRLRDQFKHIIRPDTIISTPHPAAIHFSDKVKFFPWSQRNEHHDRILVSSVGTVHKALKFSTAIRYILDMQCKSAMKLDSENENTGKLILLCNNI
jgi:hypothetical protein